MVNYNNSWEIINKIVQSNYEIDEILTFEILINYNHPITKLILYIHSMETFLYKELKKASMTKDESRILTLGPYASVLSCIVKNANKSRIKKDPVFKKFCKDLVVYRGMKMTKG